MPGLCYKGGGGRAEIVAAMKITEALLAEHLVFHNMLDHIETTTPKLKTLAEVKSLAAMLESMLKAHSKTEDELFLGPLEHCFEQLGQRDAFVEEHEEMNEHLRRIRKVKRLRQARVLFLAAVRRSREHFDKEERIVFPMAEEVLKTKTLTALGQTWMRQRMDTSVCANCDNKVCV
jgi:hemerythrin-like domain-containing protein